MGTRGVELAEMVRLREEIADVEAQQDRATVARLAKAGVRIAPVTVDSRAQLMKLDMREARGDAKRRGILVTRGVLEALKRDPPRRTVTGNFRVH